MRPWDLRAFPSLPKTSAARILVTRDGRDRNVVTGWTGTKVRMWIIGISGHLGLGLK